MSVLAADGRMSSKFTSHRPPPSARERKRAYAKVPIKVSVDAATLA